MTYFNGHGYTSWRTGQFIYEPMTRWYLACGHGWLVRAEHYESMAMCFVPAPQPPSPGQADWAALLKRNEALQAALIALAKASSAHLIEISDDLLTDTDDLSEATQAALVALGGQL